MSKETFRKEERVETDNEVIRAAKEILGPLHYKEFVKDNGPITQNKAVLEFVRYAMYENYRVMFAQETKPEAFLDLVRNMYREVFMNTITSELMHVLVLESKNFNGDIITSLLVSIGSVLGENDFTSSVRALLTKEQRRNVDISQDKINNLLHRLVNCAISSAVSYINAAVESDKELILSDEDDVNEEEMINDIIFDVASKSFVHLFFMCSNHQRYNEDLRYLFLNDADDEEEFNQFPTYRVFQMIMYDLLAASQNGELEIEE